MRTPGKEQRRGIAQSHTHPSDGTEFECMEDTLQPKRSGSMPGARRSMPQDHDFRTRMSTELAMDIIAVTE